MAIDLARGQPLPKPCGVASLPPWNRAAEISQGSEGAFRRLYFRRNRELHIASAIAAAHMGVAEVCLKPKRRTGAATFLLSSRRCARTDRIGASSKFDPEGKRKTSLLVRSGSRQQRKFATGEARARSESINIEAGRDGMTSLVAYQGVGDRARYPLQRRAQPSATDAAAPEDMQMRRSPPQTTTALRGHAGVMQ
jgi:hypothetical protein